MEKKYTITLDAKQSIQLGLLLDEALRCSGIKHLDIIVELRNQVKNQMPVSEPEKTEAKK